MCLWTEADERRLLVCVNYSENHSQCRVTIPDERLKTRTWTLRDLLSSASYVREGQDLCGPGLYRDMQPWETQAFSIE